MTKQEPRICFFERTLCARVITVAVVVAFAGVAIAIHFTVLPLEVLTRISEQKYDTPMRNQARSFLERHKGETQ